MLKSFSSVLLASALAVAGVAALPQAPESSLSSTRTSSPTATSASSAAPSLSSSASLSSSTSGAANISSSATASPTAGAAGPIPTGPSRPGDGSINVTAVTTTAENQTGFECWSVSESINTTAAGGGVAVLYDFAPTGNVTLSFYTPGADLGTVNASTTYWALVSSGLAEFSVSSASNTPNATDQDSSTNGTEPGNSTESAENKTEWAPVTPGLYGLVLVDANESAPLSYNLSFPGASLTTLLAAAIDQTPEHTVLHPGQCNATSVLSALL